MAIYASGKQLNVVRVVTGPSMGCGNECLSGVLLLGKVAFDLVLGLDWLVARKVAWFFQPD